MHVWINENFIEKTKAKAKKASIDQIGDDGKDQLLYEEVPNESIEEFEIQEDRLSISINNDMGHFSFEVDIDSDDFIKMLEIGTKKFNKLKSVFEGLK